MARRLTCFVVLSVIALVRSQNQCGEWAQKCVAISATPLLPATGYVNTDFEVLGGISSGEYNFNRTIYSDAACSQPELIFTHAGRWAGLGPSTFQNETNFMIVPASLSLTPLSANAVNYLTQYCACGSTWALNTERFWAGCPDNPENCRINFLGVGPANSLIPYVPLYGNALVTSTAMSVSRFDGDLTIGFSSLVENQPYPGSPCLPEPVLSHQFCGTWAMPCVPSLPNFSPNNLFVSLMDNFYFSGLDNVQPLSGVFRRTRRHYADFCSTPALTVEETGTLRTLRQTADLTTLLEKRSWVATITPHSQPVVNYLNQVCPCAANPLWSVGVSRQITTCPLVDGQSTCTNTSWFQDGEMLFGQPVYGTWLELVSFTRQEVRMGPYSIAEQAQSLLNTRPGYSRILPCDFPADESLDYCGTWSLPCGAGTPNASGLWGNAPFDTSVEVTMTTAASNTELGVNAGGAINYVIKHFLPGQECKALVTTLLIQSFGFWSDTAARAMGQSVTVTTPSLLVTPFAKDTVDLLNNPTTGCPCGGEWVAAQARVLTSCPAATCPGAADLGAGLLGSTGFGSIVRVASSLRLTALSPDSTTAPVFGMTDPPLDNTFACATPTTVQEYCGSWRQECQWDALTGLDMQTDFLYLTTSDYGSQYAITRQWFSPGTFCNSSVLLVSSHVGVLTWTGPAGSVPGAMIASARSHQHTVTSLSQAAADLMTQRCACGAVWTSNSSLSRSTPCPDGTCPNGAFLRRPFGNPVSAVFQRISNNVRISSWSLVPDSNASLAVTDLAFSLQETGPEYCPSSAPGGSSSSTGISGGSVFLIVLFAVAGTYFIGGLAFNYLAHGQVSILHASFWSQLPGLVADGFRFATCSFNGASGYAAVP
eukprot:m.40890 g.40890  ORF g.40890 m.40890 type:complete len:879 (-) comp10408_c1_seq1:104-2740(-)